MNYEKKTIIDVRTHQEFTGGNVAGSINIPLQELEQRLEEIKNLPHPIVLCCASGVRSSHAALVLNREGVDCENGGSWMSVNNNY